jgi:hypothetical protein
LSHTYLDHIRELNKIKASKCHICKKQSTGINAYGYRIEFVCKDHFRAGDEVILDISNPNVLHYIYPNGKKVSKEMMNPNIGGYLGNKTKEEQDAIWSSQISFEE